MFHRVACAKAPWLFPLTRTGALGLFLFYTVRFTLRVRYVYMCIIMCVYMLRQFLDQSTMFSVSCLFATLKNKNKIK